MTPELKPQDLKVGDVVDVTLHRLRVHDIDALDCNYRLCFAGKNCESYLHTSWLSDATITRSPEVIEAGDVVRYEGSRLGEHSSGEVRFVEDGRVVVRWSKDLTQFVALSDLTLISKGAKS